jgi:hypothetical protein
VKQPGVRSREIFGHERSRPGPWSAPARRNARLDMLLARCGFGPCRGLVKGLAHCCPRPLSITVQTALLGVVRMKVVMRSAKQASPTHTSRPLGYSYFLPLAGWALVLQVSRVRSCDVVAGGSVSVLSPLPQPARCEFLINHPGLDMT